jgi:hypothetical protein
MYPLGQGFVVQPEEALTATGGDDRERAFLRPFRIARDLTQVSRSAFVIDFYPLGAEESRAQAPNLFQRVLDRVKPQRDQDNRESRRRKWWLFAEPVPALRHAVKRLDRFIFVPRTAKHFTFQFATTQTVPDTSVVAIASDDQLLLGLLSSRLHLVWARAAGGMLEDRPRYQHASTFNPFPFPTPTPSQATRIRALGEQLDAHRKRQQSLHPTLTITGMYNVLEKLRSGEALTAKEKGIHEQGLVSVLKQIHDDLDAAVFDAYGWPSTLTEEEILERLVALNAERAEEERHGLVRWLRPEFQNPSGIQAATQTDLGNGDESAEIEGLAAASPRETTPWPASLPLQIAAVRDLVASARGPRRLDEVVAAFRKAKPKEVKVALESLSVLGLALAFETDAGRAWQAPSRAGTSPAS